jgi:hypothetical protein
VTSALSSCPASEHHGLTPASTARRLGRPGRPVPGTRSADGALPRRRTPPRSPPGPVRPLRPGSPARHYAPPARGHGEIPLGHCGQDRPPARSLPAARLRQQPAILAGQFQSAVNVLADRPATCYQRDRPVGQARNHLQVPLGHPCAPTPQDVRAALAACLRFRAPAVARVRPTK